MFTCLRSDHWILLVLMPKSSCSYFMDSLKAKKKDYTLLKSVLDDAMFKFNFTGGHIVKKFMRGARVRINHVTDFCCR
jgi:hypothetical protein